MSKGQTLQDPFLNSLRKDRIPVSIFLVNGIKLQGQIESFDQYVVLLKNTVSQMVYKHAISTVVPARNPRPGSNNNMGGGFASGGMGGGFGGGGHHNNHGGGFGGGHGGDQGGFGGRSNFNNRGFNNDRGFNNHNDRGFNNHSTNHEPEKQGNFDDAQPMDDSEENNNF